ncbi:MAG TPA: pseudouridine synthase [Solirubrobacterales bacterium]|nr:pseudouridine synthase [Solirubrobacterales bacterium]
MRLGKYLAHAGVASRRGAERMIAEGRVLVGGQRVTDPARDVGAGDDVRVDGRRLEPEKLEYFLLHKPIGVLSTASDPQGRPTVTELVDSEARLYPVGRLDIDSSGLVLMTNDGELANRLMHPRYEVPRTYRAQVGGSPSKRALQALREGVELEDGRSHPARIRVVGGGRESVLEITIHEGRNRIVRRMLEAVGYPVRSLERVAFGPLELGRLRPGGARRLRPPELTELRRAAGLGDG